MLRIAIMTGILFALAGYSAPAAGQDNACGGQGHKKVTIEYSDGKFSLDEPVIHTKRKKELRFYLKPSDKSDLNYNYKMTVVVIKPKRQADSWPQATGSHNERIYLKVCVDEELQARAYEYTIEFTDPDSGRIIGLVDPKVIIEEDD